MTVYKASLSPKLPKVSAITPEVAEWMWYHLAEEHVGIVVFTPHRHAEGINDDDSTVKLQILDLELARTPEEAETLRTFLRGIYRLRTGADTLDGESTEPGDQIETARTSLAVALIDQANALGWKVTLTENGPVIDAPGFEGDARDYVKRAATMVAEAEGARLASITRRLKVSATLATQILDVLTARGILGEADELNSRPLLITGEALTAALTELDVEMVPEDDDAIADAIDAASDDDQPDTDGTPDDVIDAESRPDVTDPFVPTIV